MRNKSLLLRGSVGFVAIVLLGFAMAAGAVQRDKAQLKPPTVRDVRRMEALKEEVRHQLAMLPYYSVFDWLQAEVKPDGTIILSGQVVGPTLKDDAEARVKKLEDATRVINEIEVLPLSPMDDQLRIAVTLKGIVANQGDSDLAYMAARQVPNVFDVKNELQIEQGVEEKVSRK